MLSSVYPLIVLYFLLGAIAIVFINKKKNQTVSDRRNRWVKYLVYLLIVNSVVVSIAFNWFHFVALLISMIAIIEFVQMALKTNLKKQLSFGIPFLSILFLFIWSTKTMNSEQLGLVYTLVFCFDGFAQIIGQLLGKRQITPRWSPNKTVAGFVGAFIITVGTAFYYCYSVVSPENISYSCILISGIVISLFAFSGDILASLFKRICGAKDYSNLIPQHGGILDRFDSFIFALAGYYFVTQILPINAI